MFASMLTAFRWSNQVVCGQRIGVGHLQRSAATGEVSGGGE